MSLDPLLPVLTASILIIVVIGILLRAFNQPYVIGYIIAGLIIGPYGLGIIEDKAILKHLGAIGVDFLLFYIGMEVSPRQLINNWRVSILGTTFQIIISVLLIYLIGIYFSWDIKRIILIGFVISLSSTAVIIKILQEWDELNTPVGQNALGVLLAQDIAIVPMLILINYIGSRRSVDYTEIILQIIGAVIVFGIIAVLFIFKNIRLPYAKYIKRDHELQVFTSLFIFLGLALLTALLSLSTALGAFIAGMFIASVKETEWVHASLNSFKVVFLALFFTSIGMMINLSFLINNVAIISMLLTIIFFGNTFVNAV
ncbi:MAG: cation:proton antiporter, partial [Spirochaetota bacterium]|nr:cation:proton antiporter [Spirochaetota bacterium]